jgi:hypothetical protein
MKKYYQSDFTAAQISAVLHYAPTTGLFTYKRKSHRRAVGQLAGRADAKGYFRIRLFGREFKSHRLAWLLTYGVWPVAEIDHINGIPGDNRLKNLRAVDAMANGQNRRKAQKNNRTGLLGVCPAKNGFRAQIKAYGVIHASAVFATPEEAHTAYITAKRRLHPAGTL